ncbi:ABC transporter permease [Mucilaginibacter sp. P25]|uniref:ABC transporter permease n=1 Tax=Mucilaginibacter sp. P25 TaxID=3423945 RepID=UPI003D7B0A01
MTTAQASQRSKEIGIRKTLGGTRKQLIFQFLLETFFLTLSAVVISLGITPILRHIFSEFIITDVKIDYLQIQIIVFLLTLTIAVSLISGFYPAILLSSHKPVKVLKNQSSTSPSQTRDAVLRKTLTTTQFIVAQFFIMATILVSKQIHFALNKDLGYKKDAIIFINTSWRNRTMQRQYLFRDRLRAIPQIELAAPAKSIL